MTYSDLCLITEDVLRLARFYEVVFETKAEENETHSGLNFAGTGISIYKKQAAIETMGFRFPDHAGTGYTILGFNVADVDAEYERLKNLNLGIDFIGAPTSRPWGARSFHFRDPAGNLLCFRT